MIEYFEQITQEEQERLTEVIQTLFYQTYLLERRYDRRTGRMQYVKEYQTCGKHLEFLREYFAIAGITLKENAHMGVVYIQGGQVWAKKLSRLGTIYLLVLKLIYDDHRLAFKGCLYNRPEDHIPAFHIRISQQITIDKLRCLILEGQPVLYF